MQAAHMTDVLNLMQDWIEQRDSNHYVVATGMHGVMEARRDAEFKAVLNAADLFVPDGISLVWAARCRGFKIKKRVCGSDLMWEIFQQSPDKGYKHFFYGDTDATLASMRQRLLQQFPHLQIVGTHSPPFRALTQEEDEAEIEIINNSGADVIWVGLGLPRQERWMYKHRNKLNVPVAVGVGAAFKFLGGQVTRAPAWVGDRGFEWLWRFAQEPKRVWRRVLIDGPNFVGQVALELTGLKKYD